MKEYIEILGIKIDNVDMNGAVERAKSYLSQDELKMIFTPNPEMVINATKNEDLKEALNNSDMNIPDGNGIVWASKKIKKPLAERVAGFDFIHKLFDLGKNSDIRFYLLGAKPEIVGKAKENLENQGVNIVGFHDGYFKDEQPIIDEINNLDVDVLLVALGAPKQEVFIYKNKDKLKAKIAIGVGGSFDVISGEVKRAPKFFIKLKLEWLYRGLTDIKRIRRLMAIPEFMLKVSKQK